MRKKCLAGSDNKIKGKIRQEIKAVINNYIMHKLFDEGYIIFMSDEHEIKLYFGSLHKGIIKNKGVYANCSDFRDDDGNLYNVDFLVIKKSDSMFVSHTFLHYYDTYKGIQQLEIKT